MQNPIGQKPLQEQILQFLDLGASRYAYRLRDSSEQLRLRLLRLRLRLLVFGGGAGFAK